MIYLYLAIIGFLISCSVLWGFFKTRQYDRFKDFILMIIDDDWKSRTRGENVPFVDIASSFDKLDLIFPWEDKKFFDCIVRRK